MGCPSDSAMCSIWRIATPTRCVHVPEALPRGALRKNFRTAGRVGAVLRKLCMVDLQLERDADAACSGSRNAARLTFPVH